MMKERSKYFQEIAHRFIAVRGAPFFLSSTDIDQILTWESMGIPLRIVLEGIERTFESHRSKAGGRGKIHSLAFCKYHVFKAFEQFKERRVGAQREEGERGQKQKRIQHEIQDFLGNLPPEISYLEKIYTRAQRLLSRREVDEEELERMEKEVEGLLLKNSPPQEREKMKEDILKEYPSAGEEEVRFFLKVKLLKSLRDTYRIPYISFFYY